jgi:hypothetical protein
MGSRTQGTGISLRGGPPWEAWQGARLPRTYVWKKALETGTALPTGPDGKQGGRGGPFTGNSERWLKEDSGNGASLSMGAV